MKKIKLGLVGAGNIAKLHLEVLQHIEWMEVVGITSRTRAKAEQLAKDYQLPICANNMDELARQADPDALMVLVSEDQMYPVTLRALEFKRPLFVEKPAGLLPWQNKKLAEVAQQNSILTMVGYNRRYYSIFHKGLDIIKQHGSLLGVCVEGHERMWRIRESGNFSEHLMDHWIFANSVHTIDLIRFFGGEVKNIKTISHRLKEKYGDQFAMIAELDSGAIGEYVAHWYSPGGWRVVLYGEGVTVEFKPLEKGVWSDKNFKTHEIMPDEIDVKFKPGFYRQMEAFGRLVLKGEFTWPMLDLKGSYHTMALADQLSLGKTSEFVCD